MSNDIEYINEDIEDEYDAVQTLERLDHRNRMLVKWTKLGPIVTITNNK